MFDVYLNVLASGLATGVMLGLVAVGFALYYQVTKLFQLAYGSVFTVGAYMAYQVAGTWGLGVGAGFLAGIAAAAIANVVIDSGVFQPLTNRGVDRHMILVSGLGADALILAICGLVWGGLLKYYPPNVLESTLSVGPLLLTWLQLLIVGGGLAGYLALYWILNGSSVGKAIRALAADPEIAVLTGVSVRKVRLVTAGLTGAVAGLAATFHTLDVGVHAGMSLNILVMAASGALLGGHRGITGAFVAGIALGVLQDAGSLFVGSEWKNSIAMVVLLAALAIRTFFAVRRRSRSRLGGIKSVMVPR